jgi:hypothetical protein
MPGVSASCGLAFDSFALRLVCWKDQYGSCHSDFKEEATPGEIMLPITPQLETLINKTPPEVLEDVVELLMCQQISVC